LWDFSKKFEPKPLGDILQKKRDPSQKKSPKVTKICPNGEISPNLVTLQI
jgi:hypothetical protein